MAISPEIERQNQVVEEIPDNPQVPPELEQGLSAIPSQHTNVPQASDDAAQQITPVPTSPSQTGPSIIIPFDPEELKKDSKGGPQDASTWNAWFWLRAMKRAIANQIAVLVSTKGRLASGQKGEGDA